MVLRVPGPEEVRGAADRRGEPEEPPAVGSEDLPEYEEGDDRKQGEGEAVCEDDLGDLGVNKRIIGLHGTDKA